MTNGIVIVGGGLAAARVATAFREAGGDGPVTILSADTDRRTTGRRSRRASCAARSRPMRCSSSRRPPTPSSTSTCASGARSTAVRPGAQAVALDDGDAVAYDRLVLASGSLPRALGTPGETLDGVHTYRTLDDAEAVRAAAETASSALVIGGGFIGMETTASLRRRGLAVTQVDLADALYASLEAPAAVASRSSGSTASAASR